MAFYETFNLTIDDEIVDPSGYAQGDIQTTYAGTATTITQTHIVDGYKILIEFDDDFGDNVDLYLEGAKVISSRSILGKDHIAEAGDLSVESIVVNVGKEYEGLFKVVSYQGNTGLTIGNISSDALGLDDNIGYCTIAGFANTNVGSSNFASAGVLGVGVNETTSINPCVGVRGHADSRTSQNAYGGVFTADSSTTTAASCVAIQAQATGGTNNVCFSGIGNMGVVGNFELSGTALIGSDANLTDFPLAKMVVSEGNSTHTHNGAVGVVGEASGDGSVLATGVGGVATTNGSHNGRGVVGVGKVTNTADTGKAIGVFGRSIDTHAGDSNIAIWANAANGATNYSFYGEAGEMYNLGNVNFAAVCAADTFRLASDKYIGYSAAVGTAPTGGLRFNTSNTAIFTGNITNNGGTLTITKDGYTNIIARSSGGNFSQIDFEQSNGTLASRTKTLSGNTIGQLRWFGRNDTANIQCAQITSIAIGDFSATSSGSGLYFQTVANGSTTLTGRWFIAHDGHFMVSANNTYDLATAALTIRQAHVTAYYNYRTVDNEAISHLIYETGSDSIMRRMTLANAEPKIRAQMFTNLSGGSYSNFYLRSNGTGFEFANPIASINMQANLYDLAETIVNNVGGDQVRLDGAMNNSQTVMYIEKTSGVVWAGDGAQAGDYLPIDNEIILVNSADAPDSGTGKQLITSISRAQKGTTAASHLDEASVQTITYSYTTSIQPVSVATGKFESGDKVRQVDLSPSINFVFDKSSNVTVVSASVITVSDTNKWFIIGY